MAVAGGKGECCSLAQLCCSCPDTCSCGCLTLRGSSACSEVSSRGCSSSWLYRDKPQPVWLRPQRAGPDAVISCHREEGMARLDTRAKLSTQTPKDSEMRPGGREGAGNGRPSLVHLSSDSWGLREQLWDSKSSKQPWRFPRSQLLTTCVNKLRCRAAGLQAQPPWQCGLPTGCSARWDPLGSVPRLHR